MPIPLLLPALVMLTAQGVPNALEMNPGIFVLKGAPDASTYASLKAAKITHVINLRRDNEPGFDPDEENIALSAIGINYVRLAMTRSPSRSDLDLFRDIVKGLPAGSRVLVHCDDGNRASAAVCAYLVIDKGIEAEGAIAEAKQAGLRYPDTERALRHYLDRAGG